MVTNTITLLAPSQQSGAAHGPCSVWQAQAVAVMYMCCCCTESYRLNNTRPNCCCRTNSVALPGGSSCGAATWPGPRRSGRYDTAHAMNAHCHGIQQDVLMRLQVWSARAVFCMQPGQANARARCQPACSSSSCSCGCCLSCFCCSCCCCCWGCVKSTPLSCLSCSA